MDARHASLISRIHRADTQVERFLDAPLASPACSSIPVPDCPRVVVLLLSSSRRVWLVACRCARPGRVCVKFLRASSRLNPTPAEASQVAGPTPGSSSFHCPNLPRTPPLPCAVEPAIEISWSSPCGSPRAGALVQSCPGVTRRLAHPPIQWHWPCRLPTIASGSRSTS